MPAIEDCVICDSTVTSSNDVRILENCSMSNDKNCDKESEWLVSSTEDICTESIFTNSDIDGNPHISTTRRQFWHFQNGEVTLRQLSQKYIGDIELDYVVEELVHMLQCDGCEEPICETMRQLWYHKQNCKSCETICGIKSFFAKLSVFHMVDCCLEDCVVESCNEYRGVMFRPRFPIQRSF